MYNLSLEISQTQLENLLERLPIREKLRLVQRLERETWATRLNTVVGKMRNSIRKARISSRDIERICEDVKREYDERHRSH